MPWWRNWRATIIVVLLGGTSHGIAGLVNSAAVLLAIVLNPGETREDV